MSRSNEGGEAVLPLAEERVSVGKRSVETGRVRVRTVVDERQEWVRQDLAREEASVERVPIDREVDEIPQFRWEGDVLIVPVVEEILVVEKRLVLKEEVRIRKVRAVEPVEQPVSLRSTRAVVERSHNPEDEPET